jgi:hypothetical protein
MSIRIRGVKEVTSNMRRSANGAQSGAARATRQLAREVLRESQALVPIDTGALKSSGRLTESLGNVSGQSVTVTYGTKYAVFVHEDLEKKHPVGQAKFLEIPWVAIMGKALSTYKFLVGRSIDREVR